MLKHHLYILKLLALALAVLIAPAAMAAGQSTCHGRVDRGSIEGAVSLPRDGPNFVRMSQGPVSAGRVYVHAQVHAILLDAYAALAADRPGVRWVYGETGLAQGGPMPPHKTHQNGTSVDLFVPVLDKDGASAPFPLSLENGFGYKVAFDAQGRNATHAIDFAGLGELVYQLQTTAKNRGAGIALLIFQRELRPKLFESARGAWLKANVPFADWDDSARHDGHVHVDFAVACN